MKIIYKEIFVAYPLYMILSVICNPVAGLYATEKAGERTGRLLRRTIIRYVTLSYCIALRTVR